MQNRSFSILLLLIGFLLGAAAATFSWNPSPAATAYAQPDATGPDLQVLQIELDRLKSIAPDQAHAMQDVEQHFTNVWFAGQQGNWPLAQFYLNETRSHLHWAVRIIPVRKDSQGREVKLEEILEAAENSAFKQLDESIKATDREKFVAAYEFTLTNCYACHKAAEKPFLRPRIPEHPATTIINLDPKAAWPP